MVLTLSLFQPEPELGFKDAYEATHAPVASDTSNPEPSSVKVEIYPVTVPPRFFSREEEPRTEYVTDDETTEGQGGQTATVAPKLVPQTIDNPPSPGPLISVLATLIFLAIVIFIIQVRSISKWRGKPEVNYSVLFDHLINLVNFQAARGITGCVAGVSSVINSFRGTYVPQWH